MSENKEINLVPFGIFASPKVSDIRTIKCVHSQNWELSQAVVCLKNGKRLFGNIIIGSGAEEIKEKLFQEYGRILDGR
jgi:hypothetical protein